MFSEPNMYFNDEVLNRVPANGMDLRSGNFSSAGNFFSLATLYIIQYNMF